MFRIETNGPPGVTGVIQVEQGGGQRRRPLLTVHDVPGVRQGRHGEARAADPKRGVGGRRTLPKEQGADWVPFQDAVEQLHDIR